MSAAILSTKTCILSNNSASEITCLKFLSVISNITVTVSFDVFGVADTNVISGFIVSLASPNLNSFDSLFVFP